MQALLKRAHPYVYLSLNGMAFDCFQRVLLDPVM